MRRLSLPHMIVAGLAVLALFAFAPLAFPQEPQSLPDRVAAIEANNRALAAMLARLQSDVADVKQDVAGIKADVAAIKDAMRQQGTSFRTSAPNWAGETTVGATPASVWPGHLLRLRTAAAAAASASFGDCSGAAPARVRAVAETERISAVCAFDPWH